MSDKSKRWSSRRKADLVLRLLRGESIEILSRENCLSVSTITEWRDQFLDGGINSFKRTSFRDSKLAESQRLIGKLQMELELYKKKIEFRKLTRRDSLDL